MGVKLRGLFCCGSCGKSRGIMHICVTSATGRRRRGRTRFQAPVEWRCSSCGKKRGLRHACRGGTDFKARKRQAARKAATAGRKRKRQEAAGRRKARRRQAAADRRARDRKRKAEAKAKARTRPARSRGDSHEPGTCGDRDCPRYGCKAYWAGMEDCPGPHDGGG
jgi:hypothetical protein